MFPFRYDRRNSCDTTLSAHQRWDHVGGSSLWSTSMLMCTQVSRASKPVGLLSGNWLVDACGEHELKQSVFEVFCTVLGQALGLLVPVGWASLLYTSGLSTQCSAGGLNHSRWWETSS